jgi:curli biogenesis system outer membrane secretion channel CsgG
MRENSFRTNRRRPLLLAAIAGAAFCLGAMPVAAAAEKAEAVAHPAYQGPKKTLAVSRFDASGGFIARYGGWDVGGGLAAMLATELSRTNRFVIVERGDLDLLLAEKQMAQSGQTQGAATTPLLGAQTFIHGSVTEFEEQEKGGGLSLGFSSGSFAGALGGRKASGSLVIDLRLIDAASGAVLATYKAERKIKASSLALQGRTAGGLSLDADQFRQSSLGRAAREAIAEATAAIVSDMERVPWQALVAEVDGERVYINAGRNANVAPGARMRVVRRTRTISDPATGEILGGEQGTVGALVIEAVDDRFATGRWVGETAPRRGDIVQIG